VTTFKKIYKTKTMKKVLFAALVLLTIATSTFAAPTKVSSIAKRSFQTDFNQASNVIWTAGEDYSKVTFTLNNVRMEAFYEANGDIIGTSKAISLDELPVTAKRSFTKKFSNYNVKEAIRFEGKDDAAYFISAEDDKQLVIVKIDQFGRLSTVKNTRR
jgi:hypothetical protein